MVEKNLAAYLTKKEHSATSLHEFPCTNESCILTFQSFAKLERHLNFGHHRYKERNSTQLAMVADKWVKRFEGTVEQRSSNADKINEGRQLESNLLKMGWAIPERVQRRLTAAQKEFLNKLLDDGEKSGNKVSAEKAKQKMRKQFDPEDYLPVSTIKSYFSRRASKKKKGEIVDDDVSEDEDEVESEGESDEIDVEDLENQRAELNQKIKVAVSGIDTQKDEWIAIAYPRNWFPAQFKQFDEEQEEAQVHFLKRSTSNVNWFVWPEFCGEKSDIARIDEGKFLLIYQISSMVSVLFHRPIYQISFNRHDKT